MAQNWNQATAEVVKDLIVVGNPKFSNYRGQYSIGTPSTTTLNGKNTVVTLTPLSAIVTGNINVYYNRRTVTEFLKLRMPTGQVNWGAELNTVPATTVALLPRLNPWLKTQLVAADLTDSLVSTGLLGLIPVRTVLVTASAKNLLLTGSATFNIVK